MTDILQHTFYCARNGHPFMVEFSRPRQSWQFTISRISKMAASSIVRGAANANTSTINPQDVSFAGFQCPHCRVKAEFDFVHCGRCGKDVCMGAATGGLWRCTSECGQSSALSGMGLIKSHTFAKVEQAYQHLKQAPAFRPQILTQTMTPTLERLFPRQQSSGRELVKIETPKPQARSIVIRGKDQ